MLRQVLTRLRILSHGYLNVKTIIAPQPCERRYNLPVAICHRVGSRGKLMPPVKQRWSTKQHVLSTTEGSISRSSLASSAPASTIRRATYSWQIDAQCSVFSWRLRSWLQVHPRPWPSQPSVSPRPRPSCPGSCSWSKRRPMARRRVFPGLELALGRGTTGWLSMRSGSWLERGERESGRLGSRMSSPHRPLAPSPPDPADRPQTHLPRQQPYVRIEPFVPADTTVNYLSATTRHSGGRRSVWHGVRYVDLYPGVDLVLGGAEDDGGWRLSPAPR